MVVTRARGGIAAVVGGVLWLVIWAHQMFTHGPTQENEKEILLGLTWMDSAKFLVLPFALFLVAIVAAHRSIERPSTFARVAFYVTAAALVGLVVGTAVGFWPFPWGSYSMTFDELRNEPLGDFGIIQPVSSLVLTVALILFAVALARARVVPWWAAAALPLAGLTTFFLSPVFPVPGVVSIALGAGLATRRRQRDPVS